KFDYAELAAQHNELLRLVQEHNDKARSLDTKNYMARAESLLITGKIEWTAFLASQYSYSVTSEQTALATNKDIDKSLESAAIANRFDDSFTEEFAAEVDEAERLANRLLEQTNAASNVKILNDSLAIYQSL
ncbi:MAG: hypothetical protein R3313_01995, partial [Candidatus Saccharimonadales bacterium]|nr:hypothetical protein [Candidatus Saccharimonadales bacterium]